MRSEPLRKLSIPVVEQRGRTDDDGFAALAALRLPRTHVEQGVEQSDRLQSLAQAHLANRETKQDSQQQQR